MNRMAIMALVLGVAPVLAAEADAPSAQTVTISGTMQRITLPARVKTLHGSEADAVKGDYLLRNGKTLSISGSARRLYAEMDGMPRTEIVAAAADSFVARNQQMALKFDQAANGSVSGVVVTYLAPVETSGQRRVRP